MSRLMSVVSIYMGPLPLLENKYQLLNIHSHQICLLLVIVTWTFVCDNVFYFISLVSHRLRQNGPHQEGQEAQG